MNRLKIAAAALLMTLPGAVLALGLGEIQVNSKLNEPLDAEIELLYDDASEPEATEVKLASPEDFARVGLDVGSLSVSLRFAVETNDAGRYVVRVRSTQPVGDPFVDFLIEVNWPNGRLLREYVVLLDPPVTAPSGGPTVTAAPDQPTSTARRPSPAPSTSGQTLAAGGGDYTVSRGDTLWGIARDFRPGDDITINQMMMEMYRMNPDAFYQDNINALKAGAILRLPDLDDLRGVSIQDSISQVRTQNEAWEGYRRRVSDAAPTVSETTSDADYVSTAPSTTDTRDSRLEIVPPAGDTDTGMDRGTGEDQARLTELRGELTRAREELVSADQENDELQSRVEELESLVGNLERAITLKDADLADLQNQLELTDDVQPMDDPLMGQTEPTDAELEAALGDELAQLDATPAADPLAEPTGDPLAEPSGGDMLESGMEDDAAVVEDVLDESTDATDAAAATTTANTTTTTPTAPDDGIMAKIMDAVKNPFVLGGTGLIVLLGIAAAVLSRRGREADTGESLVDRMMQESTEPVTDELPVADAFADELEEETLPEPDLAGLAAEVAADPSNAQNHLALLRAHYAAENRDEFVAAAEEMQQAIGGDTHPAWMEVKAMGSNLAGDHPLFGGVGEPAIDEFAGSEDEAGSDDDFDFDIEGADVSDDAGGSAEEELLDLSGMDDASAASDDDDLSLDFDLEGAATDEAGDEGLSLDLDAAGPAPDAGDEDLSLDFDEAPSGAADDELDLDLADLDLPGDAAPEAAAEDDTEFDLQAIEPEAADDERTTEMELDLGGLVEEGDAFDPDAPESDEAAAEPALDLAEAEAPAEPAEADEDAAAEAETLAELESADDELDLGLDELDLEDADLFGDEDAVGTKLDLAKAYIDMGDPDGAKGMLEEVLAEGSQEQKDEAQGLLDGLGS
ncbi:MAG: FimV/HubP family polar landmark protein [Xanthomonadales bacterium]|nr:FimV/HubP family polar landmark protein [Xanthomonadales bacterium]